MRISRGIKKNSPVFLVFLTVERASLQTVKSYIGMISPSTSSCVIRTETALLIFLTACQFFYNKLWFELSTEMR